MTTAAFIASLPRDAAAALAQIAGWRDAEREQPHPMTRDELAALARTEVALQQEERR